MAKKPENLSELRKRSPGASFDPAAAERRRQQKLVERILRRLSLWEKYGRLVQRVPEGYEPFDYFVEQFTSLPVQFQLYRFRKVETQQWTAARLLNDPARIECLDGFELAAQQADHSGRPIAMVFGMPGLASELGGMVVLSDYEPLLERAVVSFRFRLDADTTVAMASLDEFCRVVLESGWEP